MECATKFLHATQISLRMGDIWKDQIKIYWNQIWMLEWISFYFFSLQINNAKNKKRPTENQILIKTILKMFGQFYHHSAELTFVMFFFHHTIHCEYHDSQPTNSENNKKLLNTRDVCIVPYHTERTCASVSERVYNNCVNVCV